jgi:hypothetical protein
MSITLTCQCGKKLSVQDQAAGKSVTCPACQQIVKVVASPLNEGKQKMAPKTILLVALGAGFLLFSCGCVGGGIGAWVMWMRDHEKTSLESKGEKTPDSKGDAEKTPNPEKTPNWKGDTEKAPDPKADPAKTIIGQWHEDAEATRENHGTMMEGTEFEFKGDNTFINTDRAHNVVAKNTWKVLSTVDKTVTIHRDLGPNFKGVRDVITVFDSDHIKMDILGPDGKTLGRYYLKRIK